MARVAVEVGRRNKAARGYLSVLALREAVVGSANMLHYVSTDEVVHGRGLHKADSLSVACFPLAAATDSRVSTHCAGIIMAGLNGITAVDYVANAIRPHGLVEMGIRHIDFNFITSAHHER